MSKTNKADHHLSASRKEPIQHLPFFSSSDLDVGQGAAAGTKEEPTSSASSKRVSKIDGTRQSRVQKKVTTSVTQFSSSFRVAPSKTVAAKSTKLSRSKSNKRLAKYVNSKEKHDATSKEDQKLGDSKVHKTKAQLVAEELVATIESSTEARTL